MSLKKLAFAAALLALGMTSAIAADDYPNRPIQIVIGFPPGGNADVTARLLAEDMSKGLGQPVVVESRPGAAGNIAAEHVARAKPDGYTLILFVTSHTISPAIYKQLNYDPVEDFEFISWVADFPHFFAVAKDSPFKTIQDLVEAAKAKPNTLTFGTAGVGTGQHLTGELLNLSIGRVMTHVPYRGDAAAIPAVLANEVDFIVVPIAPARGNVEAGALRLLATGAGNRFPGLPDVPTASETVAPGMNVVAWIGIGAPKGVPQPIVERLNAELKRVIALPHIEKRLREMGGTASSTSSEEMRQRVITQIADWKKAIEAAGVERR